MSLSKSIIQIAALVRAEELDFSRVQESQVPSEEIAMKKEVLI